MRIEYYVEYGGRSSPAGKKVQRSLKLRENIL